MKLLIRPHLIVLVAISALVQLIGVVVNGEDAEPAFPTITDPLRSSTKIRIVAESVGESSGYETLEELSDLESGRFAMVKTSKMGHMVTFVDSLSDLLYSYRPFTCLAVSATEVEMANQGLFSTQATIKSPKDGTKLMHLYGITALWINAAVSSKTYSKARMVHSVSSNIVTSAHKWSIKSYNTKSIVHMYFSENKLKSGEIRMSLEMVEVESIEKMKIVQTLNILSFEYSIPKETLDSVLQVPVGYGCMNAKATADALIEFPSIGDLYLGPLLSSAHRIELEATATKYANGQRMSDTISYELARTLSDFVDSAQLIRQRDSKQDIKTIFNFDFNVQFKIDMRRGSCDISNLGASFMRGERASLKFNNDLELDLSEDLMHQIFVDTTDFYFIRSSNPGSKLIEYLYFERTSGDIFDDRLARIVRTYSRDSNSPSGEVELESVTIWMFNNKVDKILESYHLNIIETTKIESLTEMAKVFDVSEECYLSDDQMLPGRDYAWIELNYPMDARHSKAVAALSQDIKESILTQLSRMVSHLSIYITPRVEIMFEDTGFILRMLLLDIPRLSKLYDIQEGYTLASYSGSADGVFSSDVSIDIDHCAELCRLVNCAAMTFCDSSHSCLISNSPVDNIKVKLVKTNVCNTLVKPDQGDRRETFDEILELRLHQVISGLQHQDYGAFTLPRVPDELVLPASETGVTADTRKQIYLDYLKNVVDTLEKSGARLPALTITMDLGGATMTMMPNRFKVEQDPLSEFSLIDENSLDGDADDRAPPFHEGISMHRYKINVFSPALQKNSRLFSGLNYDQCALACIDGKCSSFSYCTHRQECILTDIYNIGDSLTSSLIEEDADCFISQRDFISKFNKFQNVYRPQLYKSQAGALNPAECAHSCVIETNFRCLAFDFCQAPQVEGRANSLGSCFLLEERLIYTGAPEANGSGSTGQPATSSSSTANVKPKDNHITGCDHYSRSFLADFNRIEYRQIEPTQLSQLKTSQVDGRSVDQCAEICVNQLTDCTAFQFCFDPDSKTVMQTCTMIESQPKSAQSNDFQVVFNSSADGQVVSIGKFFEPDQNCHVFSLRKDSSEAHLRDLALNSVTTEEEREAEARANASSGGISLAGGLLLYLCITVLFAAIGCGLVVAKHQNEYLRERIERIQLLLGI